MYKKTSEDMVIVYTNQISLIVILIYIAKYNTNVFCWFELIIEIMSYYFSYLNIAMFKMAVFKYS